MTTRKIRAEIEFRIISALDKNGPLIQSDLHELCRDSSWSTVAYNRVFDMLIKHDTIQIDGDRMVSLVTPIDREFFYA